MLADGAGDPPDITTDGKYPVVDAVSLDPVVRRWYRRAARRPDEIPVQRSGTVLVAQLNDSYRVVRRNATLRDPAVVHATSLLLVSTRQQLVPAEVMLPSADPRVGVRIRTTFHCRVLDPVMTLEAGLWTVNATLTNYLLGYPQLRLTCLAQAGSTNWIAFQHRMMALLIAYGEQNEVLVPGFIATLVDIAVTMQPILAPPDPATSSFEPPDPAPYDDPPRPPEPVFRQNNYSWGPDR